MPRPSAATASRFSPPAPSRRTRSTRCGDACPIFPGKRYEDWELTDPAGRGIEDVRPIRDDIKHRVQTLLAELLPAEATA